MQPQKSKYLGLQVERPREKARVIDAHEWVLLGVPAPDTPADFRVELEALPEDAKR
jgi:hypothetical protein